MQLPNSFIQSIQHTKGFCKETFEALHQSGEQITSVRVNPEKWNNEWAMFDDQRSKIPWCEFGYYLPERPSFTLDPLLHAGAYYVQEASSMFLFHILKQTVSTNNKKVLDLCAAPGGKSTLLASYFKSSLLVSNEVIKSRANILVENLTKWGTINSVVTNNDPKDFNELKNFFDVLVIDAPCSGSGLFRKDENAVNEWSENNVQHCSLRQQRILEDSFDCLNEDGILVYSTCSYSEEEDEQIVDYISNKFDVESVPIKIEENWGIVETISSQKNYGYRFWPDKLKGEGFFVSVFRKKILSDQDYLLNKPLTKTTKQETELLCSFYNYSTNFTLFKQAEHFRIIDEQWKESVETLSKYLYIKKAGVEIGNIKGRDVIPSHELALSLLDTTSLPFVEVDKENALEYLRRKDFSVQSEKGWKLVKYCGLNLGWVKVLPNRINNYYPNEWRILKQ